MNDVDVNIDQPLQRGHAGSVWCGVVGGGSKGKERRKEERFVH